LKNLADLNGASWENIRDNKAIKKDFIFHDFNEAWSFMNKIASIADSMDHHPEWSNTYNRVTIILTTHDAGQVTDKDILLANEIDNITENNN
tara:strand:+ start:89 stop:364 length:276 start_codon:yes stop_codon:yes gene_type:complete